MPLGIRRAGVRSWRMCNPGRKAVPGRPRMLGSLGSRPGCRQAAVCTFPPNAHPFPRANGPRTGTDNISDRELPALIPGPWPGSSPFSGPVPRPVYRTSPGNGRQRDLPSEGYRLVTTSTMWRRCFPFRPSGLLVPTPVRLPPPGRPSRPYRAKWVASTVRCTSTPIVGDRAGPAVPRPRCRSIGPSASLSPARSSRAPWPRLGGQFPNHFRAVQLGRQVRFPPADLTLPTWATSTTPGPVVVKSAQQKWVVPGTARGPSYGSGSPSRDLPAACGRSRCMGTDIQPRAAAELLAAAQKKKKGSPHRAHQRMCPRRPDIV